MDEVYLVLRKNESQPGMCYSHWIYESYKIPQFLSEGWTVFRVSGICEVTEVTMIVKTEKDNGSECTQPAESNH